MMNRKDVEVFVAWFELLSWDLTGFVETNHKHLFGMYVLGPRFEMGNP